MTVNAKELEFILDNTPSEQNIMLVGKHGIGKSRILEEYFADKNAKVVTLFLGQMSDPGDLIGLPEKNEKTGKTDFMLPYWFPTDGQPVVLFLDELNRARPEVLQTIMDLTLNRKLAGKSLPAGSRIISAVNNGNEYQLTDLDPALVSRFNIYEFAPTVEDWLDWARKNQIDARIISFIDENPEFLDSDEVYSSENLERAPDRRSWERVSKIIQKFDSLSPLHQPLVSGIIGNRATSTFFDFVKSHRIPSAGQLMQGDFSENKKLLEDLTFSDFTQLNEAIFRWGEKLSSQANIDNDKNVMNAEEKAAAGKNLTAYFDWLADNNKKELQAHFASLISASDYPDFLNFILEYAQTLYKKLLELSENLGSAE